MNFITSAAGNGAIGCDECSYALNVNYPVAKVGNAAGYYVAPTANAVAIALTKAVVGTDQTAQLDGVYTSPDPRAYPTRRWMSRIFTLMPSTGRWTGSAGS